MMSRMETVIIAQALSLLQDDAGKVTSHPEYRRAICELVASTTYLDVSNEDVHDAIAYVHDNVYSGVGQVAEAQMGAFLAGRS